MHTKDKIIRQFGITSKYKGYRYLLDAIHIAAENYDECLKVTKDIYPVIAHKYGVTKVSVERDIRTVIEKCWDNNKAYLQELSGCKLSRCPSNSEFIDIIAQYTGIHKSLKIGSSISIIYQFTYTFHSFIMVSGVSN